jgi:hypothetical protein
MKIENTLFLVHFVVHLFQLLKGKSMFAVLHSDINSQVGPPSFNRPALLQKE